MTMDDRDELLAEIERTVKYADPEERDPALNEIWRMFVRARVVGVIHYPVPA